MSKLLSENTSQNPKVEKKDDDKVSKALESLKNAIITQSKTEGKEPSYVFALRIADGVKTNWNNGKIPTVEQLKDKLHSLSGLNKEFTANSLLQLGVEATLLGHVLDLADKNKAKTKKDKPDTSDSDLDTQRKNFIEGVYEVASTRKAEYEKKQKAKAEEAKRKKESQS